MIYFILLYSYIVFNKYYNDFIVNLFLDKSINYTYIFFIDLHIINTPLSPKLLPLNNNFYIF